ncbi:MAG: hypothetical protein RL758_164 [Pseudomonadota bacterium]|jgi:hypothetical protein
MNASDRSLIRQACACWVSAESESAAISNHTLGNARSALYWRARSVVVHDRVLRLIDSSSSWQDYNNMTPKDAKK